MEELTIQDYYTFTYVLTPDTTACYRFGMPLGEQYMEKQDEISYGTPDIQTFIRATQYFQNQKAARENAAREDVPIEDATRGDATRGDVFREDASEENTTNEDSTPLPKVQSQQS